MGRTSARLRVYLHQYQLVPLARTCELLADLYGQLSAGTLAAWAQRASHTLGPTMAHIAGLLVASPLQHGDETGVRVEGQGHSRACQQHEMADALDLASQARTPGVGSDRYLAALSGAGHAFVALASYDRYAGAYSVCGAHLVQDLTYAEEEEHQAWAGEMKHLLLSMHAAAEEWRQRRARCIPVAEREQWQARYFELLAEGFAAQAPPAISALPKRRGRQKQCAAKNLLDDLLRRAE